MMGLLGMCAVILSSGLALADLSTEESEKPYYFRLLPWKDAVSHGQGVPPLSPIE